MIACSRRVAIALLCVLAAGCDPAVGPGSQPDGQLLFVSAQDGPDVGLSWGGQQKDIYRMNADGSGRANLTQLPSTFYYSLSLSPDGRKVAFYSDREGCPGVFVMNVDGTDIKNLTAGFFSDVRCNRAPRWSRDGSRIAFNSTREGTSAVYVMNADGSNPRNVSAPLDKVSSSANYAMGWSPDGRVIFHHYANNTDNFQAYIVSPDGTNMGPLFGRTGDHSPAWSPDGSKVAFIRATDVGSSLFVMNADGSNIRRLTHQAGKDEMWLSAIDNEQNPWSPDGTRIAFVNNVNYQFAVEVIGVDGTGHVRLTDYGDENTFGGWSPDGRITFTSRATGSSDVYLINADGSGQVNLTNSSSSHERYALWVPRR